MNCSFGHLTVFIAPTRKPLCSLNGILLHKESHRYLGSNFHMRRTYVALKGAYTHAGISRVPQRLCKHGICTLIGFQPAHSLHLHHKTDPRMIPLFCRFYQLMQVLCAAFCRCIRKSANTLFLQCDTLDFNQMTLRSPLKIEIDSGCSILIFRLYKRHTIDQSPTVQEFVKSLIRCL